MTDEMSDVYAARPPSTTPLLSEEMLFGHINATIEFFYGKGLYIQSFGLCYLFTSIFFFIAVQFGNLLDKYFLKKNLK